VNLSILVSLGYAAWHLVEAWSWAVRVNGPAAPPRLRCFVPVYAAHLSVVFIIVGHPRQMEPFLTHDHARATPSRAFCPISWWWNWCRCCLPPLWPMITPGPAWRQD